ncbi:substrate-binding domain-containing protein [Brachybacterium sp. P6-10-X1]|uniref:substrate-binding domain-containing protein n=1 Tax=Brachybacterium sp. P6-10-X1 TaxID=1903186 RepID=UPI00155F57B1|nr:substrate-binding domain-containing protein [Brachybacterium sp. P6-10-X1]
MLETVAEGTDPAAAQRARILLAAADGISNTEIAESLGASRQSVLRWRGRYGAEGVDCLRDRPRPGRPQALSPAEIVARALRAPSSAEAASGRWSTRTLANALGISSATVARAWTQYGLAPSEAGALEFDTRPTMILRPGRIVGLLLNPPVGLVAFVEAEREADGHSAGEAPARQGPRRAGLEAAREIAAELAAARAHEDRTGVAHPSEKDVAEFLENARERGAQVIGTGAGIQETGETAAVDTFSEWRRAVEALTVAAAVAGDVDGLSSLRERLRDSAISADTVIWSDGDVSIARPSRVTMRDVATAADVSIKTVSNALTGAKHVAPGTQRRIDHAVRELGYQVNTAARQLRTGRHGALVLAVPELRLSYFAELAEKIIDEAERHQLSVLVQTTRGDLHRELRVIDSARRRADGLIIAAHALRHDTLSRLTTTGPLVVLGEAVQGIGADQITISNADAATTAMDHLLEIGRRRVVMLGIAPRAVAEARVRGCRASADRHGVDLDPALMLPATLWRRDEGERALLELLDRGVPFDAVVGFNDELALGAQHALLARGVNIPEDVAVIGFDNSNDAVYSTPGLTSIAPAFDVIARTAVSLVTDYPAKGSSRDAPIHVIAPHRLMVRGSTS